jgi:hydrogenase nickel incorporation protein HypA/HybF
MHELSIAYSLVEIADEEAQKINAKVEAVRLRLGVLSGVVKEALLFSYDIATQGTRLEHSKLLIEDVPLTIYCSICQAEWVLDNTQSLRCPVCNTLSGDIRKGKELEITALEVADVTTY